MNARVVEGQSEIECLTADSYASGNKKKHKYKLLPAFHISAVCLSCSSAHPGNRHFTRESGMDCEQRVRSC